MRRPVHALLVAGLAAGAAADWQGAAPGSPVPVAPDPGEVCVRNDPLMVCRSRSADFPLADIAVLSRERIYRDGRLARTSIIIDVRHFARVQTWLEQNLGRGEVTRERLRAGMGGALPNTIVAWRLIDRCVLLDQHFLRVTQSGISIMSPGECQALLQERAEKRVRGMRDL